MPLWRTTNIKAQRNQRYNHQVADGSMYRCGKVPQLQPLTGETILPRSANKQEEARADIRAKGFWNRQQNAFFDVRVFHPNAHRATETQRSQHSTGNRRMQRRGNMETG